MSRARDNANLGAQAGSGLDASDITSGALGASVTGGAGLAVSTATTTALNAKLALAGGIMSGNITMGDDTSIGIGDALERIEFDAAGDISVLGANLGIGTDAPGNKLTILGTGAGHGIDIVDADVGHGITNYLPTNAFLRLGQQNATEGGAAITGATDNAGQHAMTFHGLTTATPTATVNNFQFIAAIANGVGLNPCASDKQIFQIKNDATACMTVLGSGNVGIGVSPGHRLHVYQDVDDNQIFKLDNPHSSRPRIMVLQMSGASPDDTTQTFVEGNDSGGAEFRIRSDGSYYQNSDRRTKENIVNAEAMLDKVNDFRVVNYNRIGDKNKNLHLGCISQEVEEIFPHLVFTEDAVEAVEEVRDEDGNLITEAIQAQEERITLYKIGLIFPLIKAVQELSAKNDALETENTALKTRMDALEARVLALES